MMKESAESSSIKDHVTSLSKEKTPGVTGDIRIPTTDEGGEDTEETSSGDEGMGVTTTVAEGENAPCNFKNDGMRDDSSKDGESNESINPPAGENELRVSRVKRPNKSLQNRGQRRYIEYLIPISKARAEHNILRKEDVCENGGTIQPRINPKSLMKSVIGMM